MTNMSKKKTDDITIALSPLQVEQYYLDLDQGTSKAFALASILLILSAITLVIKLVLEGRRLAPAARMH